VKAIKALLGEFRTGQGLKGQLLRGGFWSLAIKLLSTVMALVLAVVLARLLGSKGFGIYSFVFALITILAIPAQMGLPNLVVRETAKAQVAERWDKMKGLWRWSNQVALAMSLALIGLGALAAWMFATHLGVEQVATLWWGLLLIPLVALGNLRGAALRGLRKVVQGQLPEFVLRPLFFIALILVAWGVLGGSLGPAEAMMLHVVAALAAFAIGAWLLLRERPQALVAQRQGVAEGRVWFASAVPLAFFEGILVVHQNVGIVATGWLDAQESAGVYRIAYQGALFVSFAMSAANIVVAPYIARMYQGKDIRRMQTLCTLTARISFLFSLMVLAIFIISGHIIIVSLFGIEYTDAYFPLLILSAGNAVGSFFSVVGIILNMTGNERIVWRLLAVSLVANVILCVMLIPSAGANGAAAATAASMVMWKILLWNRVRQLVGVDSSILGIGDCVSVKPSGSSD
jgi:O-antigen/teichoic acid export membrane protein